MTALSFNQKYGKKWTHIARDVLPSRGKEGLRSRWAMLEVDEIVGWARRDLFSPSLVSSLV